MIHVFVGTKAQFIKMVPIMIELKRREIPYNYVDSGQHVELTRQLRKVFGITEPNYLLSSSDKDITKIANAIQWFFVNIIKSILNRKWLKNDVFPNNGICLIHGDTLSTLLGALMAIMSGVKVCHVEAGLRSNKIFDPFPEEIIRLICMRCSAILFAPSETSFENLKRLKLSGEKIFINGNTIIDSIRYIKSQTEPQRKLDEKYAVATCHRLETISDRTRLSKVIDLLNRISKEMKVVLVLHKPTLHYIKKFGLFNCISPNILINDMMEYPQFLSLITASEIVLADGGSIQEECAFLNIKCLIIRNTTERADGIGINAMLWKFDKSRTEKFLKWKIIEKKDIDKSFSPSKRIVDHLIVTAGE